jgi:CBS domain-containing protein
MLPALPLDGGRVLRAILWGRRGDLAEATRAAVTVARACGRGLIAFGLVTLLFGFLGGAWLALIGWFVLNAASNEELAAPSGLLARLRVADVAIHDPETVPAAMTLERFLEEVVVGSRHTAYPVVAGDELVGLISFHDAQRVPRAERARHHVAERMVPRERVLVIDESLALVEQLGPLLSAPLRRAFVSSDGRIVGMLSPTDALRAVEALRR